MKISKQNYEIFFIDYIDGRLSQQQIDEMIIFLQQNPQLEDELYSLSHKINPVKPDRFKDKIFLKKSLDQSLTENYWDELCISYIENQISEDRSNELNKLISENENCKTDFNLFQKTLLKPDLSIHYPFSVLLKYKPAFLNTSKPDELIEYYCLEYAEGNMSDADKKAFESYIEDHPDYQTLVQSFKKTKLIPDINIVYKDKTNLKHFAISSYLSAKSISVFALAAAIITFIYLLPVLYYNQVNINTDRQASNIMFKALLPEYIHYKYSFNYTKETNKPTQTNSTLQVKNRVEVDVREAVALNPIILKMPVLSLPENNKQLVINQNNNNFSTFKNNKVTDSNDNTYTFTEYVGKLLKNEIIEKLETDEPERKNDEKISGWDVAKLAVNGINKLTGSSIELKAKHDSKGNLTAYSLDAGFFQITRGNYANH